MSGHSHWATIKGQKAAADIKKGKIFSYISRQITLAVKEGKSDNPGDNPHLRLALEKAHEANMPKANVKKAIDKGLGKSASGAALQEVTIEGYGPGGIAVMATVNTDNPNRAKSDIRRIIDRHGGSTGEPGSVAYIFAGGPPSYTISLLGSAAQKIQDLVNVLEEYEDIEVVKHNAVFS